MTSCSRAASITSFVIAQLVDLEDPVDLGEQALHDPDVATGDARYCRQRFGLAEVLGGERQPEALPVVRQMAAIPNIDRSTPR
jgi:hypothetical protein